MSVIGRWIRFGDGRVVFLGSRIGEPEYNYVGFINRAGDETRFKISSEALDALVKLRREPSLGTEGEFPSKPIELHWRPVSETSP